MAASLVTEFQPFSNGEPATSSSLSPGECEILDQPTIEDDAGLDRILDQEFPGLGVDFDFCNSLELNQMDIPLDMWNTEASSTAISSTGNSVDEFDLGQKADENFNLEDEFNQMLNDWDQLGEQLKGTDIDGLLPETNTADSTLSSLSPSSSSLSSPCDISQTFMQLVQSSHIDNAEPSSTTSLDGSAAPSPACSDQAISLSSPPPSIEIDHHQQQQQTLAAQQQVVSPQTVTLKKPTNFGVIRGSNGMLSQAKQLPLSTTLRTPVVTRGFCYTTRTGGIGVSRAVQSNGIISNNSKVTISNQISVSSTGRQDDSSSAPFFFTPLSPIKSPVSSSNAPDFFVASTRPTAEVVRTTNYNKLLNGSKNSIITTNPESYSKYSQQSNRSSSPVKIIAAVSPRSDGTSCTKIFSSNSSIRDSLPKELIDKIRAASQGRKTIAIIEPINRKEPPTNSNQVSNEMIQRQKQQHHQQQQQARYNASLSQLNAGWKTTSAIHNLSNNVSDHDYCSPTGFSRFSRKYLNAQSKVMRQMEEMKSKLIASTTTSTTSSVLQTTVGTTTIPVQQTAVQQDEGETKKDSGLESCEMSDASEDGTYDRLPRYLTNASVQTDSRPPTSGEEPGGYNRLPAYLFKPQQSLLKNNNLSKSVVEKHNIVVSPVNCSDVKTEDKPVISLAAESTSVQSAAVQVDAKIMTDVQVDDNNVVSRVSTTSTTDNSSVSTSTMESSKVQEKTEKISRKRRCGSIDSSSDETDSSYRRSFKRKRPMFSREGKLRTSSRERRRRYRGRSRSISSSTERSSSRSDWSRERSSTSRDKDRSHRDKDSRSNRDKERSSRRHRYHHDKKSHHYSQSSHHLQQQQQQQQQQQLLLDQKLLSEERKIVYVGRIEEGTLKSDLRNRFETFGPILDISLHFRERGENYGFLTFQNNEDAKRAIEHGNNDPDKIKYDLCFGGRRSFCREEYYDLDDVEDLPTTNQLGFDELLRKARKDIRK